MNGMISQAMNEKSLMTIKTLAAFIILLAALPAISQHTTAPEPKLVSFPAGSATLSGVYYLPQGNGPFPAVLWNHGSEPRPGTQEELAQFYTSEGFIFFLPHRRGQGRSPGPYIMYEIRRSGPDGAVRLQETANEDVVAAMQWLRSQPQVDANRIVVSGCSFGGIQTLLSAEKELGARAFIAFAPAAESWSNGALRLRLEEAVKSAKAPVFILQAKNDYNIEPTKVLGKIAASHGGRQQIYEKFGKTEQDAHWAFATTAPGIAVWRNDVLDFIHSAFQEAKDH